MDDFRSYFYKVQGKVQGPFEQNNYNHTVCGHHVTLYIWSSKNFIMPPIFFSKIVISPHIWNPYQRKWQPLMISVENHTIKSILSSISPKVKSNNQHIKLSSVLFFLIENFSSLLFICHNLIEFDWVKYIVYTARHDFLGAIKVGVFPCPDTSSIPSYDLQV